MKLFLTRIFSVLLSPFTSLKWLFRHHPFITFVELALLSAIHIVVVFPTIYLLNGDGFKITAVSTGFGIFFGLLNVIFASHWISKGPGFEVNNYDVLALSLKEYLESRGAGIVTTYVCIVGILVFFYFLLMPFAIAYGIFSFLIN